MSTHCFDISYIIKKKYEYLIFKNIPYQFTQFFHLRFFSIFNEIEVTARSICIVHPVYKYQYVIFNNYIKH